MNPQYEVWTQQRPLEPGSMRTYVANVRRIEREYGDLDEHYDRDRLTTLLQELEYSTDDRRSGVPNPTKIHIESMAVDGVYRALASYGTALRTYCEFREARAHRWSDYLEEARRRIEDGTLDERENYKRSDLGPAVSRACRAFVAADDSWPTLLKAAVAHPENNLISPRWYAKDQESDQAHVVRWIDESVDEVHAALVELWAEDDRTVDARIRGFDARVPSRVFGEGRRSSRLDVASYLLMGLDLEQYPPCRLGKFRQTYERLWYPEADATDVAGHYQQALRFLDDLQREASDRDMDRPNTRLDAQSVVWLLSDSVFSGDDRGREEPSVEPVEDDAPFLEPSPRPLNTILYGPPGTGKTYATLRRCLEICDGEAPESQSERRSRYEALVREGRVEFVTFHQSYGYEEFVEGLRPDATGEPHGGLRLKVEGGVVKRLAERARQRLGDTVQDGIAYVLVIDEINRADISKVMGELITILEEDKRERAKNELAVTLPYSRDRFTLPANLHILGTMNTADRSIALLDSALRRRFRFEEVPPDPNLLSDEKEQTGVDLPLVLRLINERLEYLVDRDHLIGHAWFMGLETREDVDAVMRHKVIPLIAEYFYDDWAKVRAVLGGGDDFVMASPLSSPPGLELEMGEERHRWTVQGEFGDDAYESLIGLTGRNGASE